MNETNSVVIAADTAAITKLHLDWATLKDLGGSLSRNKIKFVNLGREIGLGLQGLCKHEQINLTFFEHHKSLFPESFTFQSAQRCVHLAKALERPIETLDEANRVECQMLLAGGFLEEPHRTEKQSSHYSTPDTFIFTTLAVAKERLLKRIGEAEDWDKETRASIVRQVEQFEATLAVIKAKLSYEG